MRVDVLNFLYALFAFFVAAGGEDGNGEVEVRRDDLQGSHETSLQDVSMNMLLHCEYALPYSICSPPPKKKNTCEWFP